MVGPVVPGVDERGVVGGFLMDWVSVCWVSIS